MKVNFLFLNKINKSKMLKAPLKYYVAMSYPFILSMLSLVIIIGRETKIEDLLYPEKIVNIIFAILTYYYFAFLLSFWKHNGHLFEDDPKLDKLGPGLIPVTILTPFPPILLLRQFMNEDQLFVFTYIFYSFSCVWLFFAIYNYYSFNNIAKIERNKRESEGKQLITKV